MDTSSPLYMPPEIVDEAIKASSLTLTPPPHATTRGRAGTKGFTSKWTELVEVVDAKVEELEAADGKPAGRWAVVVNMRVSPESVDATNVGMPLRASYLMNPSSLSNRASNEFKMTLISMGKLNNLLRAAMGVDPAGQGMDYQSYFGGDHPAIVGSKLYATVKLVEGNEYPQDVIGYSALTDGENG